MTGGSSSSGVLTCRLCALRSGPWRYDRAADGGQGWRYRRDGHTLHGRLEEELGSLCGAPPPALAP